MKIACDPKGGEALATLQQKRWASFKHRGSWESQQSTDPSSNEVDGNLDTVRIIPNTSLQQDDLASLDSSTVRIPANNHTAWVMYPTKSYAIYPTN
jgi:hypothetical protein